MCPLIQFKNRPPLSYMVHLFVFYCPFPFELFFGDFGLIFFRSYIVSRDYLSKIDVYIDVINLLVIDHNSSLFTIGKVSSRFIYPTLSLFFIKSFRIPCSSTLDVDIIIKSYANLKSEVCVVFILGFVDIYKLLGILIFHIAQMSVFTMPFVLVLVLCKLILVKGYCSFLFLVKFSFDLSLAILTFPLF